MHDAIGTTHAERVARLRPTHDHLGYDWDNEAFVKALYDLEFGEDTKPFANSGLSRRDLVRWGSIEAYKLCSGSLPTQDGNNNSVYSHARALEALAEMMACAKSADRDTLRASASVLLYVADELRREAVKDK